MYPMLSRTHHRSGVWTAGGSAVVMHLEQNEVGTALQNFLKIRGSFVGHVRIALTRFT